MKPDALADVRGQIDTLDDRILELLVERIRLSNSIMKSKPPGQIVDDRREREIYQRYVDRLANVSTPAKAQRFVGALLGASSLYPDRDSFGKG